MKQRLVLLTVLLTALSAFSSEYYVDASRPDDTGDGANWATAKQTIQSAVSLCSAGDTVVVTNGVYNTGSAVTPGETLPNRVVATNAIVIRSVNGPAVTIIQGHGPIGSNAVRGVYLSGNAQLLGFTVENGDTLSSGNNPNLFGGGIYCYSGSVVSNCVIRNNSAQQGVAGGVYLHLSGNLLCNSIIESNRAWGGGGVAFGDGGTSVARNCRIVKNQATIDGGGVHLYHSGTIENCLIADNAATNRCGGVFVDSGSMGADIVNCTIAGNIAPLSSGYCYVISGARVKNSIIQGSWGWAAEWWNNGGSFEYSVATPLPSGTGNTTNNPLFADSDYRLSAGSPCIDAGNNSYVSTASDLDGNPRIAGGTVDMGAYEAPALPTYTITTTAGASGSISPTNPVVVQGSSQTFLIQPAAGYNISSLTVDGNPVSVVSSYTFTNVQSAYTIAATFAYKPLLVYADAARSDDSGDGSSWATAKKTIQAAVGAVTTNGTVWVTNGVYNTGSTLTPGGTLPNRVVATNAIIIRSMNGPEVTIIQGQGPIGTNAVRGVYLSGGAQLIGFTVENGATRSNFGQLNDKGGGIYGDSGSVSNCVVKNNAACEGGGIYITGSGSLVCNSLIESNRMSATGGGGVTLQGNSPVMRNCRIVGNQSANVGGGVFLYHSGTIENCLVADNAATNSAGGVYVDWGSLGAYIVNCTIAGNTAPSYGGLNYVINGATVRNSIIRGNTGGEWTGGSYTYCATYPLPSGTGNTTNNPLFADSDYRLSAGSPCNNAGNNSYVSTASDLDGNPRIAGGTVDMGAYERNPILYALLYADASRPDDSGDGTSWATAKKTIQAAVNATVSGGVVRVAAGTYVLSSQISVPAGITVQGVGAGATIVDGNNAVRCFSLAASAVVSEMTITRGRLTAYGSTGGGVYSGIISNCILSGNSAYQSGGGAQASTLYNCTLSGNSAGDAGGGACASTLYNCNLTGNSSQLGNGQGGGVYACTLYNCTLNGNSAKVVAGGAAWSTLYNCLLTGNSSSGSAGGANNSTLYNCTLSGNSAVGSGSGAFEGTTLNNCIIYPDSLYMVTLNNCWTNNPLFVNSVNGNFRLQANSPCVDAGNNSYVSTASDLDGNARIINDTVDMGAYELSVTRLLLMVSSGNGSSSPADGSHYYAEGTVVTCAVESVVLVDGTNYTCVGWTGTGSVPATGNNNETAAIQLTAADSSITWIWQPSGDRDSDGIPDTWAYQYYGNATGVVAMADDDNDGYTNYQEYRFGTDPTDPQSKFSFSCRISPETKRVYLSFATVAGRVYTVEERASIVSGPWEPWGWFDGDGGTENITIPIKGSSRYFRVTVDMW